MYPVYKFVFAFFFRPSHLYAFFLFKLKNVIRESIYALDVNQFCFQMDRASKDNLNGLNKVIRFCLNIQRIIYNNKVNAVIKKISASVVIQNVN